MSWCDNYESAAYKVGNRYLAIQTADGGYDYTIYNASYIVEDGGVFNTDKSIKDAAIEIMQSNGFDLSGSIKEVDYDFLEESAQLQGAAIMGLL